MKIKKLLLVPTDPKQKPIDVLITRVNVQGAYLKIIFINGETRFLLKDQIKEWKVIEVDEDDTHDRPTGEGSRLPDMQQNDDVQGG